jgi:hypothetical protein
MLDCLSVYVRSGSWPCENAGECGTGPSLTGSCATPNTIGIVAVAALATIAPGVLAGMALTPAGRQHLA